MAFAGFFNRISLLPLRFCGKSVYEWTPDYCLAVFATEDGMEKSSK
jgi:hypothetical protein